MLNKTYKIEFIHYIYLGYFILLSIVVLFPLNPHSIRLIRQMDFNPYG